MRLLIIGFQPINRITYPHLHQVVIHFLSRGAKYVLFRERGYFIDETFHPGFKIKNWLILFHHLATLALDTFTLVIKRIKNDFDVVLAVDNFAFFIASLLFKRVVLWSHDFVTHDQDRCSAWIHRWIRDRVSSALMNNAEIVIQDAVRLSVFRKRYAPENAKNFNVFFLPVSLSPCPYRLPLPHRTRPVILQIGGISSGRSMSDLLLDSFQTGREVYDLVFHGFIQKNMWPKFSAAQHMPWVSSVPFSPDDVYRIVENCDIGLIAYSDSNLNFTHISKASGQLVEFLRCGKPVIVIGNTDLQLFVKNKAIGIAIDTPNELERAVKKIMRDYDRFSSNCRLLFDSDYNLDNQIGKLTSWLEKTL